MKASCLFLLSLIHSSAILSAQDILAPPDNPQPIRQQLMQAPLSGDQKDRLGRFIEARNYKDAETILVRAIDANPRAADLLTLAARLFLLDKDPMNAAIAFKKAE